MPHSRTSRRTGPRPFRSAMALAALLLIAPAVARAAPDCASPVFLLPQTYGVGAAPVAVASGDFNGDGVKDLAVANNLSGNVSVLLGDGAGGFGPPANFAVAQNPASVAVADFNKDAKADLAVGHSFGGGPLSVLFGDGTGKFSAPLVIGTGSSTSVTVGDFNGDSNPDIATGLSVGVARVMLGNGAGNFTPRQFLVSGDSRLHAAGNFNGDGFEDLAFGAASNPNELVIVLGNAAGNFAAGARMTLDQTPKAIVARDFNGDGRDDLAVTVQHFEPKLEIFINDGAGNFGAPSMAQVASDPLGLAAADFNNDGKVDLAVGNGSAQIFFGSGNGSFSTNSERYIVGGGPLHAGDFNNDGKIDLVSPRANVGVIPGVVSVILGKGDGTFDVSRSRSVGGFNTFPSSLAVTDFNGDGRSDVASTFSFSSSVNLILGDGAGGLGQTSFHNVPGNAGWVATGDFDGDGKADAATANTGSGSGSVTVFYGDGAGAAARSVNVSANATFVAAGNFNGDANSDLVALNSTGRVTVLLSTGPSSFAVAPGSPFELAPGTPFGSLSALAVGDFNGDGRDDLSTATSAQNTVSIFLNDGAGRMTLTSTAPIPIGTGFRDKQLVVGDFNRDGRADVVSANAEERNVTVFLGDGAGGLGAGTNFASTARNLDSTRATFMAVADFDGDTNPDLAVSNSNSSFGGDLSLLFGDGAGGFGAPFTQPVAASPGMLAAGNFNGDSKPDLAIIGLARNAITVLQNVYEPLPCLSVGDVTLTEGDSGSQNAGFNVTLSQASTQTVRINYSIKAVTAAEGTDYTPTSGRLVFAPGETSKTIPVPVAGDALDEADETFEFNLASASGAGVADGLGLGTINDNDPMPTLSVADITVTEGGFGPGGSATFKIQLSAPSGRAVTVSYATAPGTATAGTDYSHVSFTATIPAGQTSVNVSVVVATDTTFEPDETFFLELSAPVNATIADGQGQCTIVNDDPVPTLMTNFAVAVEGDSGQTAMTFTLMISNRSSLPVSVDYATADETAVAPGDYVASTGTVTFAPEETLKTFAVMVNGDTEDENDESFLVNFSNPVNVTLPADTQVSGHISDDEGPAISVGDVVVTEGNGGITEAHFIVRLSAPTTQIVRLNYSTANGTALSGEDYSQRSGVFNIPAGLTSGSILIRVFGDTKVEPDETLTLNISSALGGKIADAQGVGTILDDDEAHVQLSAQSYTANEGDGKFLVTVTRSGVTSGEVAVDYETSPGTASDRSDYTTALGTLRFAAGETQKTVVVLVTDDALAEGAETLNFTLGNATGGKLRGPLTAAALITDNDDTSGPSPVRDDAFNTAFFVRQHYRDFLNRDPDQAGLDHWVNQIESCGADAACRVLRKINVSAAFFLSIEFQETGYLAYRAHKAAYGDSTSPGVPGTVPVIRLREFLRDSQRIGRDVQVGVGDWLAQLQANKQAYAAEFVARQRFLDAFPLTLSAAEFVDKLNQNAGGVLSQEERDQLVAELAAAPDQTQGRANALRRVSEDDELKAAEKNRAFVLMQYYGYMRRNPDDPQDTDFGGWKHWLDKLNEFGGNFVRAEMVRAFLESTEYKQRFGQP